MGGSRILGAEEAFRLFDEFGSDFLSVHASDGTYLYASSACQRLFGWEPAALIGTSAYEYFHPEDVARIQEDHAKHESGDPGTVRYRLRCADERWCWVETRSQAQSEGGNIVAITRDVHQQVLAEQRRRAVVESMSGAVAHEISNPLTIAELQLSEEASRAGLQRLGVFLRELRLVGRDLEVPPRALDLRAELAKVLGEASAPASGEPLVVHARPAALRQLLFLLAYDSWGAPTQPELGAGPDGVWIRVRISDSGGDAIHADLRSAMEGTVKLWTRVQQVRDLAAQLRGEVEDGPDGVSTFRFPKPDANER